MTFVVYRFFYAMIVSRKPIILASSSPRRAHLMSVLGFPFTVRESGVDEIIDEKLAPEEIARGLAFRKASTVASQLSSGIVIGADTIVVLEGKILGKPATEEEAVGMLLALSGKTHTVFTGFALVDAESKKSYISFERTEVTFRALRRDEIERYVAAGSPMDKAGAYGIQDDYGAVFVEKIDGCFYNVVGFPISKFHTALTNFLEELK
jgi:septum formation protein